MAIPVLIMGRSGSGKTYSIKNFKPEEVGVISVEKGRLPFKSDIKVVKIPKDLGIKDNPKLENQRKYEWLEDLIERATVKSIVIDDSQYLLVNEMFDRAKESGYNKFTDIAVNFRDLIHYINETPQPDKIVYFLHHSEVDERGREKAKTVGKMLDEKLVIEGCFDVVLYCDDQKFYTQANGQSTAKSPEGMFDAVEIPNDLKAVDTAIREYWNLGKEEK